MTEPRRLKDSGADDFERGLISSCEDDVPSSRAYQRTLTSLGVGLVLPLGATAAQGAGVTAAALPAAKLSAGVLGKWLALGAVAGVVTASGAHLTTRALAPAAPFVASSPVALPASRPLRAAATLPSESVAALSAEPAPERAPAAASPRVPPVSEPALPPASLTPLPALEPTPALSPPLSKPALASSLEGELARLEEARRALGRGDARAAIVTLKGYRVAFPSGALAPEASLLEVSALLQAGERERARELGRRIIAADPQGPHAQAVRSLLSETNKP